LTNKKTSWYKGVSHNNLKVLEVKMMNKKSKKNKRSSNLLQVRGTHALIVGVDIAKKSHWARMLDGQPVISVDTKKKELVGDFKNTGAEWQPKGQPEQVRVHDFEIPELGKVSPYGVYDPARNEGWINVGTDHDTAAFAVASIRGWWRSMGWQAYPEATELLITADGGGSNNSRSRLWKVELQKLADDTGLRINVCHFPPGTSKWNQIEHRLFSHITQNWRGRPLESHEVIINLIANTTTATGLKVQCQLDTNPYPTGVKVSDIELAAVQLERLDFHGDWNYIMRPHSEEKLFSRGSLMPLRRVVNDCGCIKMSMQQSLVGSENILVYGCNCRGLILCLSALLERSSHTRNGSIKLKN
jgi:hypothetical protein